MAPRLTLELKSVVLDMVRQGFSTVKISSALETIFGHKISRQGLLKFLKKRESVNYPIEDGKKGDPKVRLARRKFLPVHSQVLDLWLSKNKDLTARDVQRKFSRHMGVNFSIATIKFQRRQLDWTMKKKSYCQLISVRNKVARLNWCSEMLLARETFSDVIFVDESNVEISSNARMSFYKPTSSMDKVPRRCAKPKHAYTVHVWAVISYKGRTNISIFTGIMDSVSYQKILEANLLPFVRDKFPNGFRLYQDNDSKHKSKSTRNWMEEVGILDNVMVTPASSPDLNPIENVWSSMKDYIQKTVKPKTKDDHVRGIREFWETLTVEKCTKYIDHIHKVMPVVVLNNGDATDF